MKPLVIASLAFTATLLMGCSVLLHPQEIPAEVEEAKPVHPLSWVENAVVNEDIENAVAHKDYRLLAFDGLRITVPGIALEEVKSAQHLCGVELLYEIKAPKQQDTEQTINERDQQLMNKALDYVYKYNREMLELCKLAHNT